MRYLTIVSLFTLFISLPLQAAALPALYEAEVEVADQGAVTRAEGMRTTMMAVLLKVSGSGRVAEDAALATAVEKPASFVQQYSYRNEGKDRRLVLQVRFDPHGIDELLRQSGFNIWGDARPTTLIWLGVEDGGKRVLVGDNDRGLVREIIDREAARRALPVKLPGLDRTDLDNVRPADVWGEFLETIKGASQRYAPQAILVGRAYPVLGSRWEARWSLDYRGEIIRWQSGSGEVAPLIAEAVDRVTDHIVSKLTDSSVDGSGEILMEVEGVRNLRDYRRVINYLKGTRGVKQVVAESMSIPTIRLRIVADGGIDSLMHTISLGKTLAMVSQPLPPRVSTMMLTEPTSLRSGGEKREGKYPVGADVPALPEPMPTGGDEPPQPDLVYRLMP